MEKYSGCVDVSQRGQARLPDLELVKLELLILA
jgi:hypothetical protein